MIVVAESGFGIMDTAEGSTIECLGIEPNGGAGVYVLGGHGDDILDNAISGMGDGVVLDGASSTDVYGNKIELNSGRGIVVADAPDNLIGATGKGDRQRGRRKRRLKPARSSG